MTEKVTIRDVKDDEMRVLWIMKTSHAVSDRDQAVYHFAKRTRIQWGTSSIAYVGHPLQYMISPYRLAMYESACLDTDTDMLLPSLLIFIQCGPHLQLPEQFRPLWTVLARTLPSQ